MLRPSVFVLNVDSIVVVTFKVVTSVIGCSINQPDSVETVAINP
jgi:hypothetical protein